MNIVIREAEMKDYEDVDHIMDQVQALHHAWRPDVYCACDHLLSMEYFRKLTDTHLCFVSVCDDTVTGIMILEHHHIENPSHITKDILFIDTLAVDEPYRRKGIGRALIDYACVLRNTLHCDSLELQVNARNTNALAMYKQYGFTEKSINMELK